MKLDCLSSCSQSFKKREKKSLILLLKKKANNLKSDIKKRSELEVVYIFNEEFIYLAITVFGNPTLNSYFKFLN